jgi:hypothetical protein
VSQTVTAAEVIAGSLVDDGDFLGSPPATITNLNAQGVTAFVPHKPSPADTKRLETAPPGTARIGAPFGRAA